MILLPNIFKRFLHPQAETYVLKPTEELFVENPAMQGEGDADGAEALSGDGFSPDLPEGAAPPEEWETAAREGAAETEQESASEAARENGPEPARGSAEAEAAREETAPPGKEAAEPLEDPFAFAKVQAEALMRDARQEAEAYREKAIREIEKELDQRREAARAEGYDHGYAAGMADAMAEAKIERERMAEEQVKSVEAFLEAAAKQRDRLLDESQEELKDLALTVAEKVIRVSLKNSDDILRRMVEAATDTHKRCEWAHIYIADCDVHGKANTVPELAAALGHISDRVRVIPMADDESGTCIVELPDVIYDASVSTQMGNIREILDSTGTD